MTEHLIWLVPVEIALVASVVALGFAIRSEMRSMAPAPDDE